MTTRKISTFTDWPQKALTSYIGPHIPESESPGHYKWQLCGVLLLIAMSG